MKKLGLAMVAMLALSGCAAMTTTDQSGFYNPTTGKYFHAQTITVRDRTGTEMHHVLVMDDQDKVVSNATATGRGIVPGMTDGTGAALIHTGGLLGAAALWPADNYTGGNAGASQSQDQGQNQGQAQGQMQGQVSKNVNCNFNYNVNKNKNKGGGWIPPGQQGR